MVLEEIDQRPLAKLSHEPGDVGVLVLIAISALHEQESQPQRDHDREKASQRLDLVENYNHTQTLTEEGRFVREVPDFPFREGNFPRPYRYSRVKLPHFQEAGLTP
ncbi:MAG: hypothetical protein AMXMBFR33_16960 [Candidatus Xenobia bacterium]